MSETNTTPHPRLLAAAEAATEHVYAVTWDPVEGALVECDSCEAARAIDAALGFTNLMTERDHFQQLLHEATEQVEQHRQMLDRICDVLEVLGYNPDDYGGTDDAVSCIKKLGDRLNDAQAALYEQQESTVAISSCNEVLNRQALNYTALVEAAQEVLRWYDCPLDQPVFVAQAAERLRLALQRAQEK